MDVSTHWRRWFSIPRPAHSSRWFPMCEAQAGIPEAASLRSSVAPSRRDPAFQRVLQRAPRLLPTDCSLCQGKQILGAGQIPESSFPFGLGVLAYLSAFPKQSCLGRALLGFAWECFTDLSGPRPAQELLHSGGSGCTSPDEAHKYFMPQTAQSVQD